MASLKTKISWTTGTWNPTTGCTKASPGCDHCYAEKLYHRLHGDDFSQVQEHPDRLDQLAAFKPHKGADGRLTPPLVFVNSMSDLMHRAISRAFVHRTFDKMEAHPLTICQVLTKRPMTLRAVIEERYKTKGVPANIWLGVSVEDNRVRGRIDDLRRLKDSVGDFTAFLSVEPLIGRPDKHDYTSIDQVLIGGESGPNARDMPVDDARCSRDRAGEAGAAIWFKQFGKWSNNPLYRASMASKHIDRVRDAIDAGEQKAEIVERTTKAADGKPGRKYLAVEGEKGGATLDGRVHHEYPPAYHRLVRDMNTALL